MYRVIIHYFEKPKTNKLATFIKQSGCPKPRSRASECIVQKTICRQCRRHVWSVHMCTNIHVWGLSADNSVVVCAANAVCFGRCSRSHTATLGSSGLTDPFRYKGGLRSRPRKLESTDTLRKNRILAGRDTRAGRRLFPTGAQTRTSRNAVEKKKESPRFFFFFRQHCDFLVYWRRWRGESASQTSSKVDRVAFFPRVRIYAQSRLCSANSRLLISCLEEGCLPSIYLNRAFCFTFFLFSKWDCFWKARFN